MGRLWTFTVMTILFNVASGLASPWAMALSEFRWKKRPLVVFAQSEGDAGLAGQRALLAENRGALRERDIVIVYVIGDSVSAELGAPPSSTADQLRKRYGVAQGIFRAVLVGKDGGAKLSSSKPLSRSTLLGTIDAMPMRQQEMQRR